MRIVLKYGGNALSVDPRDPVILDAAEIVARGDELVVVHGGGPQIDAALAKHGIGEQRIDGLRVTDAATLEVTEQALCATVNKALVRALLAAGVRAVGISGQDGAILRAARRPELGFVGAIPVVDPTLVDHLLRGRFTPVVAPLALDAQTGTPLNVNADEAAGALAGALGADAYVVITNVEGVRANAGDPQSTIRRLSADQAQRWLDDGTLTTGMRPKVRGTLEARARGAGRAIISGTGERPISGALEGAGTEVV